MSLLGWIVIIVIGIWVIDNPVGAANTVVYIAHSLSIVATSIAQHLNPGKPS